MTYHHHCCTAFCCVIITAACRSSIDARQTWRATTDRSDNVLNLFLLLLLVLLTTSYKPYVNTIQNTIRTLVSRYEVIIRTKVVKSTTFGMSTIQNKRQKNDTEWQRCKRHCNLILKWININFILQFSFIHYCSLALSVSVSVNEMKKKLQ